MQAPDHPLGLKLVKGIKKLLARLAENPELHRQGENLKRQILDDPHLHQHAHRLWTDVERRLQTQWGSEGGKLNDRLTCLIQELGACLRNDPSMQRALNL